MKQEFPSILWDDLAATLIWAQECSFPSFSLSRTFQEKWILSSLSLFLKVVLECHFFISENSRKSYVPIWPMRCVITLQLKPSWIQFPVIWMPIGWNPFPTIFWSGKKSLNSMSKCRFVIVSFVFYKQNYQMECKWNSKAALSKFYNCA